MTIAPAPLPKRAFWNRLLLVFWVPVILFLTIRPTWRFIHKGGQWIGDYDIWYSTGRLVCLGQAIYPDPRETSHEFPFMYPPPTATLLAPLTLFGKIPFTLILDTLNSIAWIGCVFLAAHLITGRAFNASPILYALPAICCLPYISDTYHLGQVNLVLLALLLGAFVCLRQNRPWATGLLVGLAAAIKAFPVLTLVYLLYRRQWRASLWTIVFLAGFLLLLPLPARGWSRNLDDLSRWSRGMLFHYDAGSIAQRSDVAFRWKNQSIVASVNRLFRHVPADSRKIQVDGREREQPVYANLADLSFNTVNGIVIATGFLLCLGFIAVMPPQRRQTARTDTIELSMLLVLMILFSPLSWYYFGVWLMLPLGVVVQFILEAQPGSRNRKLAIVWLLACLLLFNFVLPLDWVRPIRNLGVTFFGDLLLLAELAWIMRRELTPPADDRPPAPRDLPRIADASA